MRMLTIATFVASLLFIACSSVRPCTPGACLAAYDRCHGSKGEVIDNDNCTDCSVWKDHPMTERDAALIDAKALCQDTDIDRQLLRYPVTFCDRSIEDARASCEAMHEKYPLDPFSKNCERYSRPYHYHWETLEEYERATGMR